MSQPGVSRREELWVVLFDRVKRPIQLIPEGPITFELIIPIVQGIETLKELES